MGGRAMITCTISKKNMESLSLALGEKNKLSLLSSDVNRELSKDDQIALDQMGVTDIEGNINPLIQPTMNILSQPYAVVKMYFTGGSSIFEHNINYDENFDKYVSVTVTPKHICIDDVSQPISIISVLKNFIGISNIKSIEISGKYNEYEARVLASVLDIERRAYLRAFVDEISITSTTFNSNMIWRITNSTSSSIQWLVSIIGDIIGSHESLSLQQVQMGIDGLVEKGVLEKDGDQYRCIGQMSKLSGRMIIIDNILSTRISKINSDNNIVSSGFTCVQSGVHDLLFLDYDGKEVSFEMITSSALLDCMEKFIRGNTIFPNETKTE